MVSDSETKVNPDLRVIRYPKQGPRHPSKEVRQYSRDRSQNQGGKPTIHYTQYYGYGTPQKTFGSPGDIYIDVTRNAYKVYVRYSDWLQWAGVKKGVFLHRRSSAYPDFFHPADSSLTLWCNRRDILWLKIESLRNARARVFRAHGKDVVTPMDMIKQTDTLLRDILRIHAKSQLEESPAETGRSPSIVTQQLSVVRHNTARATSTIAETDRNSSIGATARDRNPKEWYIRVPHSSRERDLPSSTAVATREETGIMALKKIPGEKRLDEVMNQMKQGLEELRVLHSEEMYLQIKVHAKRTREHIAIIEDINSRQEDECRRIRRRIEKIKRRDA